MKNPLQVFAFIILLIIPQITFADTSQVDQDVEKNHQRLELMAMWKMMDRLDLDKPTAEKIFEIRHNFVKKRKDLQKLIREDQKTLKQKLEGSKTTDAELSAILDAIRAKRMQVVNLQNEQYDEISKLLTVRQRAQLVLFLKEFQKEIRNLIHNGGAGKHGARGMGKGAPEAGDD
jgi:hypothetical protein